MIPNPGADGFSIPGMAESSFGPIHLPDRQSFGPGATAALLALLTQQQPRFQHPTIPAHSGQYADFRYAMLQRFLNRPHINYLVDPNG